MKRLFTSCFGLGLLPIAPGTWGSLPPVLIFVSLCYFSIPKAAVIITMAALVFAGSFICVRFSPEVINQTGKKDPGEIVADEFAGQSLVFIFAAISSMSPCLAGAAGFGLFRLFDITKPFPIRKLEKLPKGWGILADDLLAGVYAAAVLLLLSLLKSYYAV